MRKSYRTEALEDTMGILSLMELHRRQCPSEIRGKLKVEVDIFKGKKSYWKFGASCRRKFTGNRSHAIR